MLLYTGWLKGILQDELDEDVGANGPSLARDARHHHFFDCLHQIVEVWAQELAIDDLPQALKDLSLGVEAANFVLNNLHQGLYLCL